MDYQTLLKLKKNPHFTMSKKQRLELEKLEAERNVVFVPKVKKFKSVRKKQYV